MAGVGEMWIPGWFISKEAKGPMATGNEEAGQGVGLDLEAVRARVEAAKRAHCAASFQSEPIRAVLHETVPALLAEIDRLTAEVGEWVSVDERVPEDAEDVIVVDRYGNRSTAYLCEGTWYTTARYRFIPTHWQPLPAQPE